MSIDGRRRAAAAILVALIILALFWPVPVIVVNDVCCDADLDVDELSFLGREAPSWDVVYWAVVGVTLIAMFQWFPWTRTDLRAPIEVARAMHFRRLPWGRVAAALLAGAGLAVACALVLDAPALIVAESLNSDAIEDAIRIVNRLGGGMNPVMIVLFFVLIGAISRHRPWIEWGVAMVIASLSAGAIAHAIKLATERARPELWLGPFAHSTSGATSFPSGHTVGAFAIAGVILFAGRGVALRSVAMLLATAVGLSRILAFRHWTSDVVASAILGLIAAWVAVSATPRDDSRGVGEESQASTSAKFTDTRREQPASSIVTP